MKSHIKTRIPSSLLLASLLWQLGGCATPAPKLATDKQVNNRLENPEYAEQVPAKIANVNEREAKIEAMLQSAELAWQNEDWASLEQIYAELDQFDPNNLRAKDGRARLALAQKHQAIIADVETKMAAQTVLSEELENELMRSLKQVMLENPQHPRAAALYNQLLQSQEVHTQAKLKKKLAFTQPITMEFRDVPIKMIFESLAKTTKINFILDKDVSTEQKATIFVKAMPFKDALDLLLQSNQLDKKILSENSAMIYVNDGLHQRDYKDLVVRSFTLDYADAKQMSGILKSMLNIRNIEIDTRLNTLIIKDAPEVLNLAEKIIYSQDAPDPEVMLEMQVMEVKRSNLENLGVSPPTGVTVGVPDSGVLTVRDLKNITGNNLIVGGTPGLVFNTSNGDVNLLANPRIRVKNHDIAKIHIGEKVPVFTANVASTGVTSQSVQYIDAGLKLEVEPQISSANDVTIKISLNVGSIGDKVVASSGNSESVAFRVGTRLATTQLRLHDGETQVLAGLIDDQDRKNISGLPGLSSLPILGHLFGTHTNDKSKTEIVLAITPHIIRERRANTSNQTEMWVGSEGQTGRISPSPQMTPGIMPFTVPKPPPKPSADANKADRPQNINIPLPPGFSLGDGLSPAPMLPAAKEQ